MPTHASMLGHLGPEVRIGPGDVVPVLFRHGTTPSDVFDHLLRSGAATTLTTTLTLPTTLTTALATSTSGLTVYRTRGYQHHTTPSPCGTQ